VNVSALKIHISENAYNAVKAFQKFITEPRGEIYVKVNSSLSWCTKKREHFKQLITTINSNFHMQNGT